ncbi:hypothetical protein [Nostoc sp.]|uniref:hypothetical protein n=1 Tax=Nostoc sp. TaxID=1180 RepID=UPI002FF97AF4
MDKSDRYSLELAPVCHIAMSTTGYAYAILVVGIKLSFISPLYTSFSHNSASKIGKLFLKPLHSQKEIVNSQYLF